MAANPPKSITIYHVLTGTEGRSRHKCPSQSAPSFNFIGKITRNVCAPIFPAPLGTGGMDQYGDPAPASQSADVQGAAHKSPPRPRAAPPFLQTLGPPDVLRASDSLPVHTQPCPPPRLSPTHPPFRFSSGITPCGRQPPTSPARPVTTLEDDALPRSHSRTGDCWRPQLSHQLELPPSREHTVCCCSKLWNRVCLQ